MFMDSDSSSSRSDENIPLEQTLIEVRDCLEVFLRNRFSEAMDIANSKLSRHLYFASLKGTFLVVNAIVTFEEEAMRIGLEGIHEALKVIERHRRARGFVSKLFSWSVPDYDLYDEDELHAEAAYCVLAMEAATMTIATEKSFVGLMKAGYYAKMCYSSLQEIKAMAKHRTVWSSSLSRDSFKSCVFNGVGLYNLVLSMMPNRFLKFLQVLGFHGNRSYGLALLDKAARCDGIWSSIGAILLLGHHTQVDFVIGLGQGDVGSCESMVEMTRERYPDSGFFLIFEGCVHQMKGEYEKAVSAYTRSIELFEVWPQWANACYWFLIWTHAAERQWDLAIENTRKLTQACSWSPCVFNYILASLLQMVKEDRADKGLEEDEDISREIERLLREAPGLKRTYAGKTVFLEKFVTKRCDIYHKAGSDTFVLPILELFFVYNTFQIASPEQLLPFLELIDKKIKIAEAESHDVDRECYLQFYRGVCCRHYGQPLEAQRAFEYVLERESGLSSNSPHLVPCASLELGLLSREMGELVDAKRLLSKACSSDYTHYLNETMVHIRCHSALTALKEQEKKRHGKGITASLWSLISAVRGGAP